MARMSGGEVPTRRDRSSLQRSSGEGWSMIDVMMGRVVSLRRRNSNKRTRIGQRFVPLLFWRRYSVLERVDKRE